MIVKLHMIVLANLIFSAVAFADSSFGPGKGPAVAGTGYKYTNPQPPKPTVYSMNSIRPAYQVPDTPEKFRWVLTEKLDGRDPIGNSKEVPVYGFLNSGQRVQVGTVQPGEEVQLDEIRPVGKSIYYKYAWKGTANKRELAEDFWVSGSNIEFAGKK
jgi:hypothetical protein